MRRNVHGSPGNINQVDFAGADLCGVALISNQDLIAEGICQGLEQHEKINLQDRFNNFNDLLNSAQPARYDVVLINARLIQYPLSDFFQQLKDISPRTRIIVFAADANQQYLKSLMRAGVYGFVPTDASVEELCNAIIDVKSGQLWFNKSLLDEMIIDAIEFEHLIEQSIKERIGILKDQMTERESDVFCLVLEGLSTKEIAAQIHMSEPTVKQHLTRLFKKFDVSNRSQLILSAFERVCPVTNMIKLFRRTLDRRRSENGAMPLISDPLK
jgi:DNA-binding NarL/FixJ family response regulator